ncbi:HU family DNA-binding protein [Geodermatophilus sp. SYSU D01180]
MPSRRVTVPRAGPPRGGPVRPGHPPGAAAADPRSAPTRRPAETARPRRPERNPVNKAELVSAIAKRADVPSSTVDAVLSGLQEELVEAITRGEKVAVSGLLTVERTQRSARTGRNPQTGESIEIPAANTVKVTAGSNLKKAASNVPV